MKKMKFFIVIAALVLSTGAFAHQPTKSSPIDALKSQLVEILNENYFLVRNQDLTARVLFTLDEESKIQLLEVQTKRHDLKRFIVNSLRGKKIQMETVCTDENFVVDIRMTKP
ncbi:hypothetical protein [Allomuricauda sp. d1]|uniref:hypothetical protein n=1 Tax=Allomuricauda sp. d1 TaxID=3136725 RepID=UPI0031D82119